MDALFLKLVNMGITASWLVLAVVGVRLIFRKMPKWVLCLLWGMVALRLICPFSFESSMSLIPNAEPVKQNVIYFAPVNAQIGDANIEKDPVAGEETAHPDIDPVPENNTGAAQKPASAQEANWLQYLGMIWLTGVAGMLIYAVISYLLLRRRVATAIPVRKGIKRSEFVESPFVLGVIRPVIYLPLGMEETDITYVIAHERAHIRRRDHWWKPLGFILISIYWFNPLLWAAYILLCRDIEAACDEKVIKTMEKDERRAYSAALLNCSIRRRSIAACPLAFGEVGVKERVKHVMDYKRPAFCVILVCILLCGVIAVCLLTNPETPQADDSGIVAEDEWGIAVAPDGIVKSGAEATFIYNDCLSDLVFADGFSIERWENGQWVRVEKPSEYVHYFAGTNWSSSDESGTDHVWGVRFGGLSDGRYRLGKTVTRQYADRTAEEKTIYWAFSFSNTPRIPLEELPQIYGADQAALDGCYVQSDGVACENIWLFYSFAHLTQNDVPAFIRIINWYYQEESHYYEAFDLSYDGSVYTVSWLEDGQRKSEQYLYLKHFTGEMQREDKAYGSYEHYVLVNDDTVTWVDIEKMMYSSQYPAQTIPHMTVFTDYIYYTEVISLPDNLTQMELKFQGETLITVTERDRLEQIHQLFSYTRVLGYEPKTHSIGMGLDLVLTSAEGETLTIELDPDIDVCRINGKYVSYGVPDESNYVGVVWYSLGIDKWPDQVYEKYPNALRQ